MLQCFFLVDTLSNWCYNRDKLESKERDMTITVAQMIQALSQLPQDAESASDIFQQRMDKLVTIEEDYDLYDEDTGETETKVRRVVVLV